MADQPKDSLSKDDLDTIGENEAKVFLSYSRKDREQAESIAQALRSRNFGVFRDTDDILPTEEWRDRLKQLIEEADTIVFLLSPASAASDVCAWEVEYANSLNKRIAPIVIADVEAEAIPPLLARLNFIFCTPRDPFENAVDTLVSALQVDIDWIREHTRLNGLAERWVKAGKPVHLLLRGQDVLDAERWRDSRPKDAPAVTQRQAEFIAESRQDAVRRQRRTVGGAVFVAVAALVLAGFAYLQSVEANTQRAIADENERVAVSQRAEAEAQRALAEEQRAVAEEQRALAEEQQALAEEQRAEAERQRQQAEEQREEAELQRFIANRNFWVQSFRIGDMAGGLRRMREYTSEDEPEFLSAVAGLISPEAAGKRDVAGEPFLLNRTLYLSQLNAPPLPLDLQFNASGWFSVGDDTLLLSDTSRVVRMDSAGQIVEVFDGISNTAPCGFHVGSNAVTLLSVNYAALSAGSVQLVKTIIPNARGGMTREALYGTEPSVGLEGREGHRQLDYPGYFIDACGDGLMETLEDRFGASNVEDFKPVRPFDEVRFPGAAPEATLWQTTEQRSEESVYDYARAKGLLPDRLFQYLDTTPTFFVDFWEGETFSVLHFLTNWGGTGGDTNVFCVLTVGEFESCLELHGFGGITFTADPITERVAIYGTKVIGRDADGTNNLWLLSKNGYGAFGSETAVVSAAYDNSGHLAVLEKSGLVVFDPAMEVVSRRPKPGNAKAVGSTGVGFYLFDEEGFYTTGNEGQFEFTALFLPQSFQDGLDDNTRFWTVRSERGFGVALGFGQQVMIYDTWARHPVTGIHKVDDWRIDKKRLRLLADGAWQFFGSGETYQRRAGAGRDIDRLFQEDALFE